MTMTRRFSRSKSELPFLHTQDFEDEAALLLAEYGTQHGQVTMPPIPIEDIVEEHFKLVIEYRDLRAEFPEGDVLGAMYFNKKKMAIDRSLVPDDNPGMKGRYRFTVAHELAHWRLHRHLYLRRADEPALLQGADERPDHLQRAHSKDPKEVQANRLAASILMPRDMLKRMWHEMRGNMEPVYLPDLQLKRQQILTAEVLRRGGFKSGDDVIDNMLLEHVARPLADKFEVSPEAMTYRLEGMSLLLRKKEPSLFT